MRRRRRSIASRVRQPSFLEGATLWYDGEDLTGSDGDNIATWDNKEVRGANQATQSTTFQKPDLRTRYLNSRNVLEFTEDCNEDAWLSIPRAPFQSLSEITVFMVAQRISTTTRAYLFALDNGDDNEKQFSFWMNSGTSPYMAFNFGGTTSGTSNAVAGGVGAYTPTNWNIFTGTSKNAVAGQIFINGAEATYVLQNNGATLLSSLSHDAAFGRTNATDEFTDSDFRLAEVIVYDRQLTATELTYVHRYLSGKWGITLA